ncbi:MAG: PAS domain-containing hybrid sensor histidine kinase/response regulator [Lutibacter sp.]
MIKKMRIVRKFKFEYRIAIIYFTIGVLWIYFSDTFFDTLIKDKETLAKLNIIKGSFYIVVTSILLYLLVKTHMNKLHKAEVLIKQRSEKIKVQNEELQLAITKAEDSETFLNNIFDHIPNLIFVKNANDLRYVSFNKSGEQFMGYTRAELIGKNDYDFFPEEEADFFTMKDRELLNSADLLINFEEIINTENGIKTLYTKKIAIKDKKGKVKYLLGISEDVTAKKEIESELITAKDHAEQSDRLKSAFLANMSHEIRTPMNGILGFAELLKEPNLSGEKQQKYIDIIQKSGVRMLNIINDIVDISKIEAGLMQVDIKDSNINEQIGYIYTFFKPEVEAKGLQFLISNKLPEIEANIKTDREKLYAILTNLIKNAIKFTNNGSIEFGYHLIKDNGIGKLEFYVKDTGIGISKDKQEVIFERFIQADISNLMVLQGTGLGLSITKAYVEILGGKIWVESEEGVGSTLYFTIPTNIELEEEFAIKNDSALLEEGKIAENLKILIAEDDEPSAMLISLMVEAVSSQIITAMNGNEAVNICRNNPDINLILMDIQMPEMNGYEATRQIRQFNKDVVIIAQSAYALSFDRQKAIDTGCNDYISKPILKDDLLMLIQKHLNS